MVAARAGAVWVTVRDSLWFVPALFTAASIGLAVLTLEVDRVFGPEERMAHWLLFGGGYDGARGVLSAIAQGMITVTGVTFSVTIIALQLASSQFTPRVLRNFTADRGNQVVMGVFIATFTYALVVLRAVRGEGEDLPAFIPSISVTVAVLLTIVSVGFLIYFIDHVARSIQASMLIDRVTRDAMGLVDRLFPASVGEPAGGDQDGGAESGPDAGVLPAGRPAAVRADEAGYLQVVDENALFNLADGNELTVRMDVRIGEFILPGIRIASVWPADAASDRACTGIREAFVLGNERNLRQDIELAIVELVDVALKALSPSINDPTTAMNCIDRLGQILTAVSRREVPVRWRTGGDGKLRFLASRPSFERLVTLAFDQIRHHGADQPAIAARLLDMLGRMRQFVRPEHVPVLRRQSEVVLRFASDAIEDVAGRETVHSAARRWQIAGDTGARPGGLDGDVPPPPELERLPDHVGS